MPRGYRVAIIALGLTLFASVALGQEYTKDLKPIPVDRPANQGQQAKEAADADQSPADPVYRVRVVRDEGEAIAAEQQERKDNERADKDLAAQRSMADSTKNLVKQTWWQIGIGIAGTIGLLYALCLNRQANKSARLGVLQAARANRIADRALRASIESMKRVERAYVFIGGEVLSMGEDGFLKAHLNVVNRGKTPAIIKRFHSQWAANEPIGEIAVYNDEVPKPWDHVLGDGVAWEIEKAALHPNEPYLFGYIEFVDIFGDTRVSRFCNKAVDITFTSFRFEAAGSAAYNEWD